MAAALALPNEQTSTAPDVYRGICQVAKAISRDGIGKGGKNQQQGYSFRGIDDIYNALSALLSGADLCILPRMLSRSQEERTTAKGGVLFYVTVQADFDFVSARDGSKHTVTMYGEAMDSADKATNKAMSAAFKYCCMQTFCIPTEGMADADATTYQPVPKAPKHSPAQQEVVSRKLATMPQPAAELAETIPEFEYEEIEMPEDERSELEAELSASLVAERQKRLDAFSKLKARYNRIGFARTYPAVLNLHGVRHATEFPETEEGLAAARSCYKAMSEDLTIREKRGR